MSEYNIYQDELNNIYLVENDGNADIKEDVYLSYQEALAALNNKIATQKRVTLARYDDRKGVLEVLAQPKVK